MFNQHGKPLDDLDVLKLRVQAKSAIPAGAGYSVQSRDGAPICGFVPDAPHQVHRFVAQDWSRTC